jgi:hypothetical protein
LLTQEEEIKEQMGEDGDEVDPTAEMLGVGRSQGLETMPMSDVMMISPGSPTVNRQAAFLDSTAQILSEESKYSPFMHMED